MHLAACALSFPPFILPSGWYLRGIIGLSVGEGISHIDERCCHESIERTLNISLLLGWQ